MNTNNDEAHANTQRGTAPPGGLQRVVLGQCALCWQMPTAGHQYFMEWIPSHRWYCLYHLVPDDVTGTLRLHCGLAGFVRDGEFFVRTANRSMAVAAKGLEVRGGPDV